MKWRELVKAKDAPCEELRASYYPKLYCMRIGARSRFDVSCRPNLYASRKKSGRSSFNDYCSAAVSKFNDCCIMAF